MASTIETRVTDGQLEIMCDGNTIAIDPRALPDNIREAAVLHGLKQKIVDAAAMSRDPETGASATANQKFHAMNDVATQLMQGDWNRRAAGGGGQASAGLLVAALARLTGKPVGEVAGTVKGWTPEQQSAMRASPQVAPIIAQIKAERGLTPTAGVDAEKLLGELMPQNDPAPKISESGVVKMGKKSK